MKYLLRPIAVRFIMLFTLIIIVLASIRILSGVADAPAMTMAGSGQSGPSSTLTFFPQVAIGGGYKTVFTLLNTGSDTLSGNLILTGQDGFPLNATLASKQTLVSSSSIPIAIPPGGTSFVTANSISSTDPTKVGWAVVESSGGILAGVVTYMLTASDGTLLTAVGILASAPVIAATIPIDDDASANRITGYAIANTGSTSITIKVEEVSEDGNSITNLSSIGLTPGQQSSSFLYQDPNANERFRGSAVFIGQGGATFTITALVLNQGILGAIPVIPAKSSNIQ